MGEPNSPSNQVRSINLADGEGPRMILLNPHSTDAQVEGSSVEMADAKHTNDTDNTIREFGKCARGLVRSAASGQVIKCDGITLH